MKKMVEEVVQVVDGKGKIDKIDKVMRDVVLVVEVTGGGGGGVSSTTSQQKTL